MKENAKYYRIVEVDVEGNYKTLFHGNQGSRKLEVGKWLKSIQKPVRDGSHGKAKEYTSGWHVMQDRERVEEFVKKMFRAPRNLKVVEVEIRGNSWAKAHSPHEILLVEEIKILG